MRGHSKPNSHYILTKSAIFASVDHGSNREPHGAVRHGSPRFAKPPQSTTIFHGSLYFFTRFSPTQTYQVSPPSRSIFARSVFADNRIVNTLFAYLIAFSLHLHPLSIHPRRPPRILAYDRIIPSFTHSPHSEDAVLQFSHTLSIRRSHFGRFC